MSNMTKKNIKEISKALPYFEIHELTDGRFRATSPTSDFIYTIDFNNHIVIAEIFESFDSEYEFVNNLNIINANSCCLEFLPTKMVEDIANKPYMVSVKGKAKCHEKDVFSVYRGVKLARFRALKKLYRERENRASDIVDICRNISIHYSNRANKMAERKMKYNDIIDSFVSE